jgi:hypothetical protein
VPSRLARALTGAGGPICSGKFDEQGAWQPRLNTHIARYDQVGNEMTGIERALDTRIFDGNVRGLQWFTNNIAAVGMFPHYDKRGGTFPGWFWLAQISALCKS